MDRIIAAGIKLLARTRLPKLDGEIHSSGLQANVEVLRDHWGVPHIYAENSHDLFFAQGFIHSQDRFWQMEFSRRMIAGRLAEILGEAALPLDRWFRTLTMRRVAEIEDTQLNHESRSFLQAYADGVNYFIGSSRLPVECLLLGVKPEPWTTADSISWVKMMGWTLSVNWEAELLRANLIARLGPEKAAELEVSHLPRWPYVIPSDIDYSNLDLSLLDRMEKIRPFSGPSPYEGLGSNNWVISSELSSTGFPLLANDMHLGMTVPAIWYENHLSCPDFSLSGVTFPAIPGVVAGHNGKIAWGFTNGFPDVQDLYIEHLRRAPDGTIQVEHNDAWEKAEVIEEEIRIKGGKTDHLEVIVTRHGPIMNELASDWCCGDSLAFQWTALEPDEMLRCIFDIARAQNCEEFRQALRSWSTPAQNIVFADTSGQIGYILAGKIPIRGKGNGRTPVPGWVDDYDWTGYVPFELLPQISDPEQGFIVTANNRVVGANYPINLELEPVTGDRAQRISEMLLNPHLRNNHEKLDINQFIQMQTDFQSPSARAFCRQIGSLTIQNNAHHQETQVQKALKMLQTWDGTLSADSPAALIYQTLSRKLIRLILQDKLNSPSERKTEESDLARKTAEKGHESSSLIDFFLGKGPTPVLEDTSLFGERWLPWLINEMQKPQSPWFDLGNGENKDDCIKKALEITVIELSSRFGPDMQSWDWGRQHQLTFNHNLSSNSILRKCFNVGPFPIGGDNTTIWASGANYHDLDSSIIVGPPYRMVIDLIDLSRSISVLVPGQSGNPASPYYCDQVDDWFNARYHPMLTDRRIILEKTSHRLLLKPHKK